MPGAHQPLGERAAHHVVVVVVDRDWRAERRAGEHVVGREDVRQSGVDHRRAMLAPEAVTRQRAGRP